MKKPLFVLLCISSLFCSSLVSTGSNTAIAKKAFGGKHSNRAKDMFYEQLKSPAKPINTGLSYSIELLRDGQTYKVSNKYPFKSGDSIKFHLKPNIDGYAYVVMERGSSGKQAVLFPNPKAPGNRVSAGKDIVLPANGVLTFDNKKGTEKLKLYVSRKEMANEDLLSTPQEQIVLIASSTTYTADSITENALLMVATKDSSQTLPKNKKKDLFFEEEPAVTVVSNNPDEVLAIAMELEHN